jgi:hypothetical protein
MKNAYILILSLSSIGICSILVTAHHSRSSSAARVQPVPPLPGPSPQEFKMADLQKRFDNGERESSLAQAIALVNGNFENSNVTDMYQRMLAETPDVAFEQREAWRFRDRIFADSAAGLPLAAHAFRHNLTLTDIQEQSVKKFFSKRFFHLLELKIPISVEVNRRTIAALYAERSIGYDRKQVGYRQASLREAQWFDPNHPLINVSLAVQFALEDKRSLAKTEFLKARRKLDSYPEVAGTLRNQENRFPQCSPDWNPRPPRVVKSGSGAAAEVELRALQSTNKERLLQERERGLAQFRARNAEMSGQ